MTFEQWHERFCCLDGDHDIVDSEHIRSYAHVPETDDLCRRAFEEAYDAALLEAQKLAEGCHTGEAAAYEIRCLREGKCTDAVRIVRALSPDPDYVERRELEVLYRVMNSSDPRYIEKRITELECNLAALPKPKEGPCATGASDTKSS